MTKKKDDSMSGIYERFAGTDLLKKICSSKEDERIFKEIIEFAGKAKKEELHKEYKKGYSDGVLDHAVLMMKEPAAR